MTKQDYIRIAALLREHYAEAKQGDANEDEDAGRVPGRVGPRASTVAVLARRFCGVLADDNPRFDRGRFLDACGIES